jgi:uncharacterized membrane protein YdbT with pleckstrin-like domain
MTPSKKFEETIIYKTHQHWIILLLQIVKKSVFIGLPILIGVLLFSDWLYASMSLFCVAVLIIAYEYYLHLKSWLLIGNQKVTLFIRNGLFSQYTMNIRYNNIQDCACSKNSALGYLFGYGTFFARSISGKE